MPPNRPSSGWIIDSDLDEIDLDPSDFTSSLPLKKVPNGDVFQASRAGDVERLKYLLESGVNVNARDKWDSVALYYACLAGHLDAARMLLESGAICSEHTFDGDRCHYAALNLKVRKLLKAFEARPPPLAPLQAALRDTFLSCEANRVYLEQSEAIYRVSGWCLNFVFFPFHFENDCICSLFGKLVK
jgi:ankyrin repeat/BTB/POZ domain-containing protein 1